MKLGWIRRSLLGRFFLFGDFSMHTPELANRAFDTVRKALLECLSHCVPQSPQQPLASKARRPTADTDPEDGAEPELEDSPSRALTSNLLDKAAIARLTGRLRKKSPNFPYRWRVRYCEFLASICGATRMGILVYWPNEAARLRRTEPTLGGAPIPASPSPCQVG
jgi:hypothetical protein